MGGRTSAAAAVATPPAGARSACGSVPSSAMAIFQDPPAAEPDPALAAAYTCEVLRTSQGFVRGCWGNFRAEAFYRPLPDKEPVRALRHIFIKALDIARYAEREGESIDAEELGEGSYSRVFASGISLAAKIISDRERPWVHKAAIENALVADRASLGPRCYGHGTLEQTLGGNFRGTVILLERLQPLGDTWSQGDTEALLVNVQRLSTIGFHNDLKLPNVLRRMGQPTLIDFDLLSPWAVKIAVTSSCIECDFRPLLEPLGDVAAQHFREYYDLFTFSLTIEDGDLYRAVLNRLAELWGMLEEPVFRLLCKDFEPERLREVPLEALARVPLQGVTVNLLDLRGNLYAHLDGDVQGREARLRSCEHLPQLVRSNGVYWP